MIDESITKEKAFEDAIEYCLLEKGGYELGNPKDFNRELALDTKILFAFIKDTQLEAWEKLSSIHAGDVESKFLRRLTQEIDSRGILDVLRNGIVDYGVKFRLAYFKPASRRNPETLILYNKNKLTVTRQLKYSIKNENSLDIVLSINGFPVATAELKNQFTKQTVENAKKQFREDRDPNEILFQSNKRTLVHFAIDTDEVYMTTKLEGTATHYLPFNKGYEEGAGNPPNPDGYKTAYLWEEIWEKHSWLDILGKFIHLEKKDYLLNGKNYPKEAIIFPRYHQLDAVRKLEADAKTRGAGKNYLIQHSAGSGKSNSIAWLAYRLSSLHTTQDNRVFDCIIVITDRLVLDQQLQDTIYQFEHVHGVVQKIDKDSSQLATALQQGTNVIITTLQKFPYVMDKIAGLPDRSYAIIVDEAHSSQGGETATKLKNVLSLKDDQIEAETEEDAEDQIRESMQARGKQKNLSFFAFTATPKQKTLEVFGEIDENGKPKPFHLYSMRQAIEEKFILDVLDNYTTYKTFFKLSKDIEDDPKISKKKANRAIGRFLSLHPHNISQKTEVIIEHFRQVTMKQIGGKAKAMVVTASRPQLLQYKEAFDIYIKEKEYEDIRVLVAFSSFTDEYGNVHKESQINGFGEKELPEKFNTNEYQLLIVADKYQTGFDQPLLHTMYIDKTLSGVKAVQTLSRLNRICPGKEDTFVLDFANETEDIFNAFQPYYEKTILTESTDPNKLYDLKAKIEEKHIILSPEVTLFCTFFFKSKDLQTRWQHSQLNAFIDPAVERFTKLATEEEKEDYKHTLTAFVRLYAFLAQIIPFQDIELEKLYAYVRLLITKLPKRDLSENVKLQDEIALEYYRLQKISEGRITLQKNSGIELASLHDAPVRKLEEDKVPLSEIITVLNEKFGTDFTDADKLFFDQIEAELISDRTLSQQAKNNTIENFKYGFDDLFYNKVIERMSQNEEIFKKIMDSKEFANVVKNIILKSVYEKLQTKKIA